MSKPTHTKTIQKKRKRREKLKKLREKYLLAKTKVEKEKTLEKVKRIAPWLTEGGFLAPSKRRN